MKTVSLDEVCRLFRLQLGIKQVNGEDHIQETLGAESIDLVNVVATIEERYEIAFEEHELAHMQTVADLHRLTQAHLGRGEVGNGGA
jgi:acyl carrier protein